MNKATSIQRVRIIVQVNVVQILEEIQISNACLISQCLPVYPAFAFSLHVNKVCIHHLSFQ